MFNSKFLKVAVLPYLILVLVAFATGTLAEKAKPGTYYYSFIGVVVGGVTAIGCCTPDSEE